MLELIEFCRPRDRLQTYDESYSQHAVPFFKKSNKSLAENYRLVF